MAMNVYVWYQRLMYSCTRRGDLEDILADPFYFQAIFHTLDRAKALYLSQAELGSANEAIAKNNLRLQDDLYNLRSETQTAFEEAKALERRWKEVEKEQREVYQRFMPQFLHMRLRHSITAQDDASEAVASAFIQQQTGNGIGTNAPAMDDFIKEFKDLRKIYHKRALWGEKWNNQEVVWED